MLRFVKQQPHGSSGIVEPKKSKKARRREKLEKQQKQQFDAQYVLYALAFISE